MSPRFQAMEVFVRNDKYEINNNQRTYHQQKKIK